MTAALRAPSRHALRRGILARALTASWLLLHFAVVAAVPVADARLGHAAEVVAHWEDASDTTCPPQHDTADCPLCQQLTLAGRSVARVVLPTPTLAEAPPVGDARADVPRPVVVGALTTRAPPTR